MSQRARKVALVSDWFLPRTGGVERHIVDLARGLKSRGQRVEIVTTTPGPTRVAELPDVPVIRIDTPLLPIWKVVYHPKDGAALTKLFRERDYDFIHAHSIYSPLALAACWAGNALRLPTVLTAHSMVRHAMFPVFRLLDYWLLWSSWPTVITAVSNSVAADLRRASFAGEIEVVPNGLDLPLAARRVPRRPGDPVRIISVSRLVPRKRPGALLEAFAQLETHLGPEMTARCRLVLVGGGPLLPELKAQAERLGVADLVEFRGWCTAEQVAAALDEAEFFVLPTQKEAFGIAALEAAARGLPVVTMRGSGAAELFTPGCDGLVAGSDAELTQILARLVVDARLRERLGQEALKTASLYAWPGVLDRTMAIYDKADRKVAERFGAVIPPPATAQVR